jgi:hypothetical protein
MANPASAIPLEPLLISVIVEALIEPFATPPFKKAS